jgi:putative glycosyltransferase
MKISVLTATYNRCSDIEKLYNSLIVNKNSGIDFEWLIMDDGSTDKTKNIVERFFTTGNN